MAEKLNNKLVLIFYSSIISPFHFYKPLPASTERLPQFHFINMSLIDLLIHYHLNRDRDVVLANLLCPGNNYLQHVESICHWWCTYLMSQVVF